MTEEVKYKNVKTNQTAMRMTGDFYQIRPGGKLMCIPDIENNPDWKLVEEKPVVVKTKSKGKISSAQAAPTFVRNKGIYKLSLAGQKGPAIAKQYGISPQRVNQIVSREKANDKQRANSPEKVEAVKTKQHNSSASIIKNEKLATKERAYSKDVLDFIKVTSSQGITNEDIANLLNKKGEKNLLGKPFNYASVFYVKKYILGYTPKPKGKSNKK